MDKLREVENFTQEGRAEHPIQAKLGDVANKLTYLVGVFDDGTPGAQVVTRVESR